MYCVYMCFEKEIAVKTLHWHSDMPWFDTYIVIEGTKPKRCNLIWKPPLSKKYDKKIEKKSHHPLQHPALPPLPRDERHEREQHDRRGGPDDDERRDAAAGRPPPPSSPAVVPLRPASLAPAGDDISLRRLITTVALAAADDLALLRTGPGHLVVGVADPVPGVVTAGVDRQRQVAVRRRLRRRRGHGVVLVAIFRRVDVEVGAHGHRHIVGMRRRRFPPPRPRPQPHDENEPSPPNTTVLLPLQTYRWARAMEGWWSEMDGRDGRKKWDRAGGGLSTCEWKSRGALLCRRDMQMPSPSGSGSRNDRRVASFCRRRHFHYASAGWAGLGWFDGCKAVGKAQARAKLLMNPARWFTKQPTARLNIYFFMQPGFV